MRHLTTAALASTLFMHSPASADDPARRQALFGDVHIHTSYSFDAYFSGTRRTPDDAYRYALGEPIRHALGYDIRLKGGALDFYAVTDHGEYLGVIPAMNDPASPLSQSQLARDLFSGRPEQMATSFRKLAASLTQQAGSNEAREVQRTSWIELLASADRYYRPGKFTTFAGYEYTSIPQSQNLHRVVLFRGARRPESLYTAQDSENPELLWAWQDGLRRQGIDSIAIPHNMNVSNGLMFQLSDYAGKPIDSAYAETRMRNEPIVEMTQVKGTSDTHPALSPNDEFGKFEVFEQLLGSDKLGKAEGSYIRHALQRGLLIEEKTGRNPYQFGMIGSSDTHNAGGPLDEDNYFGKMAKSDGTPDRRRAFIVPGEEKLPAVASPGYLWGAAGLAGVWAENNNREDIFDAMRRKETFATSGTRIKLRLFAGHGYPADIFKRADFASLAYARGVPMGGELAASGKGVPTFLAEALKDPLSAGLERIQIIRGWVEEGELKEAIYDIACSVGKPDPKTHRCAAEAKRINTDSCALPKAYGTGQLKAVWSDPDWQPARRAFYYLRVLESPTCRWTTWEANRIGKKVRPGVPLTIQERAWSSPIWVKG